MTQYVKKLSAKTIIGKIPVPKEGKYERLFTIIGSAESVRMGESNFGPWTAFLGEFEAVNIQTGEVFKGSQAFVPEPAESMIAAKLRETDEEGKRAHTSVEFAFEVGVKGIIFADRETYEYTVKPLVEAQQSDKLSALRDAAKAALPAPEKVENADEKKTTGKNQAK